MLHTYEFNNRFIVLDVESGAIHVLDELTFELIKAKETGKDVDRLIQKFGVDEIAEAEAELKELEAAGALNAPAPKLPERLTVQQVIKAMCLHVSHDCDLRCGYCFASTGNFKGERMLMPAETGKKALDFLSEHSGNRKNLEVDFFGGEPALNFDAVKEIVGYGRELEKKTGKKFKFTVTTNAYTLTDEMIDFFNREMYNVVISIDGRKEVHDALRKTIGGKGSFDVILPNAQKFVKAREDKDYYIRGTFTSRNLDFANDVLALADNGFTQLSLEPVVLPNESKWALTEQHLEQIEKEYDRLAKIYMQRKKEGKPFAFFHFMLDLNESPCLQKRITGCGAGSEYVAVTPNGDIFPCHQFAGEADFKMGNVITGEFNSDMQNEFLNCNLLTKPDCSGCWAKYFCSGGCAANAYKFNGDIHKPYEFSCKLQRKRIECALGIIVTESDENG